jgi:hypothetical protein
MGKPRAVVAIAFVTVLSGSALTWTTPPLAHADALADLRSAINGMRSGSTCPALSYNVNLEGDAQHYIGNNLPGVPAAGQYNGTVHKIQAEGDPEADAVKALTAFPDTGASVNDCSWKDFGVGFYRPSGTEDDYVSVALGRPDAPAPAPPAAPANSNLPVSCAGYTLPPGSDCSKTPNPSPPVAPAPPPVTDAIGASFGSPGLTSLALKVTNSSALNAACHYDAEANSIDPLVPKQTLRDFQVAPHTTSAKPHVETFNGAPTLTNYSVTITCTDASGKQAEPVGTVQLSETW